MTVEQRQIDERQMWQIINLQQSRKRYIFADKF